MLQYVPALRAAGFDVQIRPLFDDSYLNSLYRDGSRPVGEVIKAYLRRLRVLLGSRGYDLAWVEKELLPFVPGGIERLLRGRGLRYVLDYDDATFHRYDRHRSVLVRRLLGRKLVPLIRGARMAIPGNAYLAEYLLSQGARDVRILPSVVDLTRYPVVPEPSADEFKVGWIGSPSTTPHLRLAREGLERLARERPVRLVTIGAGPMPRIDVPMEQHAWDADTEASLLGGIHVGIMPLPDAPFERGKCGYKLIQYMACGRPVIASPIGVNNEIVTPDVGCLAEDAGQWHRALGRLAGDADRRRELGSAGRRRVEQAYSLQVTAPRLVALLQEAATEEFADEALP
jgi:glycosyltransferase involved in cell wall biosynthesis